jgi:hypothetical protein
MRLLVIVAVGWLPLAIAGVVEQLLYARPEALLLDPAVHVRALVAAPLFALASLLLRVRSRERLAALVPAGLAPAGLIEERAARARHLADSLTLDLIALTSAVVIAQLLFWRVIRAPFDVTAQVAGGGPGAWLYGCVTFPLFLFLALGFLLHWAVWSGVLLGLARLPLRPDAAHPDRAGGLALLVAPSNAFALFSLGTMAVASATWTRQLLAGQSRTSELVVPGVMLLGLLVIAAFAPLLVFVPLLLRARRDALRDYGLLASRYVQEFRARWLSRATPTELLGVPDIQSLSDLGQSFRTVDVTRLVPFGVRDVLPIVVASVLPLAPLVLTQVPFSKLLYKVLTLVLGR